MSEYVLNEKLQRLTPYEPLSGEYQIRLDANESFIEPNKSITGKIAGDIMSASLNRYPDPYAVEVCELFADYCGVDLENVVAGNGSDEIISVIMTSFFNKGDKIALFPPDFSMYNFYAYLTEIETVFIKKDDNMLVDIDKSCDIINLQNIKGVFLSNPCSPTSIGISAEKIIKLAANTNALVVVDEAYMDFYCESVTDRINKYDNLIVLKTCSKALAMAGMRLGFAIACRDLINALKAAKSPYNVNVLTQCYAKAVLADKSKIKENITKIIQSRDNLYKCVKAMEGGVIERVFPTCTNFVFIKPKDSKKVYEIMKKNGIAIRLLGDYLRVTAGTDWENNRFLEVLLSI